MYDTNGNVSRYIYTKRPAHLISNGTELLMITYEGCRRFCGRSKQWTDWDRLCDALMTWLLPLATLLLQLPLESNQVWATFFMLARWLGNPCVAIGGSLSNIRITSRCATLLDQSVSDTMLPRYTATVERSHRDILACAARWVDGGDGAPASQSAPLHGVNSFSHLRDSLYILTVLNQFELDYDNYVPDVRAFLCFALFCSEAGAANGNGGSGSSLGTGSVSPASADEGGNLPMAAASAPASVMAAAAAAASAADDTRTTAVLRLRDERAVLAEHLRATRKHGVVPALLSLLGFGVALAISMTQAYGQLGTNLSEYRLSLGLMMTWLPVLVACTLLDRNPTNTDMTRMELQRFFDGALQEWRAAAQPRELSRPFATSSVVLAPNANSSLSPEETEGIPLVAQELSSQAQPSPLPPSASSPWPRLATPGHPFVLAFGGQARRKWHRGVAYEIIADIERKVDDWRTRSNGQLDYIHLFETGSFARVDGDATRDASRHAASFFHTEQVWQVLAALLIVGPAAIGAFIVSFNTPPVGIGCRAGGFMLYSILAFG